MEEKSLPIELEAFSDVFDLTDEVIALADQLFKSCDSSVSRQQRTSIQTASIAIFSRIVTHAQAANLLMRSGFGVQATLVSRSSFEDLVNLFYINKNAKTDAATLADRFVKFPMMKGW